MIAIAKLLGEDGGNWGERAERGNNMFAGLNFTSPLDPPPTLHQPKVVSTCLHSPREAQYRMEVVPTCPTQQ